LFDRYKIRVLHFCIGLLGNRTDAEDAAGDVFMAVIARRDGYHPPGKFSTWLYTIARNKCVDRLRRRRFTVPLCSSSQNDPEEFVPSQEPADTQESSVESLSRRELAGRVREALARLPEKQRAAITLQQYHECSYEQIAGILHCSLAQVKITIFRGKERLRVELAALAEETS
jgi:RNA polymerase sigma-70 factor (ECF subfamily)